MSYDKKFRKRTIEYHLEGHTVRDTAKTFGISTSTLNKWLIKYRENGDLGRKYRAYKTKVSEQELSAYLKANPGAYQSEIGEHFGCHQSVVCPTLKRFKITRKKKQSGTKSKTPRKLPNT